MRVNRRLGVAIAAATIVGTGAGLAGATSNHPGVTPGPGLKLAAIPGLSALHILGAHDLGAAGHSRRTIDLVLDQRSAGRLAARVANPHAKPLSHSQFMSRFAPTTAETSAVVRWAKTAGLHASVAPDRSFVAVRGAQTALGKALSVRFDRFSQKGKPDFVSSVGTATLPAGVRAVTRSVIGLSSLDRLGLIKAQHTRTQQSRTAATLTYGDTFTPQQLNALYDAPANQTGAGQTLAIITEGDVSQPIKDLAQFESTYDLPSVHWNTISVGTPSTDTSGDDEWDLDSQYSTAFAPGVTTLDDYNGASLDDSDILPTIDAWVSQDSTRQASFSAGGCEILSDEAGFTTGLDTILEEAAAQGQTLFASSGDNGSFCDAVVGENGVPAGIPNVEYPASSEYAIGVGGTSVLTDTPTEISWYAGGGGISLVEPVPAWQANAGGSFIGVRRGVPDVALDADPESGYDVIVDGAEEGIGGTSASTPSWQGIWARIEAANGGKLTFAGPVLYETEPASAFNDIEIGVNGLFAATPGWDYTTGLGTANISALVANG